MSVNLFSMFKTCSLKLCLEKTTSEFYRGGDDYLVMDVLLGGCVLFLCMVLVLFSTVHGPCFVFVLCMLYKSQLNTA